MEDIKLLEENIGVSLHVPGLGNGFLAKMKAQETKKKMDRFNLSKIRNFYAVSDTIKKVKRR